MLNKRKNNNNSNTNSRPSGPNINNMNTNRSPRTRPFSAEGVYSNAYFLHAAASHVGDVVKVQTKGGVTVEGIFKTFSPTFNIALEVAHRYQNGVDDKKINVDTVQDNLIIKPCDIVTIYAKDVDLDYATKDTFQTDTAISSRLNGTGERYNKELVMWDSSEVVNGDDQEVSLELDKNSNGWDANEMFKHNEKEHGVKTTYKDNLIGYTVQLEDKNSHDFKEQELEAERIANEIENNPVYRDRVDLENGDEMGDEEAFSAVIRPVSSGPPGAPPLSNISNNHMNSNSNDKISPTGKYVPPQKRKIQPVAKIVRHTPPPATNSMPPSINTQQSPQAPMKSYQPMPPQQQPMPYGSQQHMPYVPPHLQQQQHHQQHSTHPGHVKLNGDGMIGNKNMPPRNIRYNTAPPPVSFNEPPPSLTPVQLQQAHGMGKPTMHVAHPHGMVTAHMVVTQDGQQATHGGPPPHVILHPVVASPSQMPPPQPQRQPRINRDDQMPRTRDDEVNSLRKFHNDFALGAHPQVVSMQQLPPDNGNQMHPAHHLQQSVDNSGPQMSKSQQHNNNYHHHQRQQQTPPLAQHQMHTQEQIKHVHSSPPPSATTPQLQGGNIAASQNNSGSNSNSGSPNSTPSVTPSTSSLDKQPASLGTKKYVLNPAAKPFTPRSPSTPTQSRPHTPQTPGPLAQNTYPQQQQGQHIQTQHPLMAMAYVMPNHAYQTQPNQAGHQRTMRKLPNLVAAATGAPLQHVPMHLPFHAQPPHQHYTSQPQFVRMYHENPQQQIQYLTQAPSTPSTTPSPGQHQQYHQGPQAAGQGPPTYAPSAHQYVPHIQMCPILPGGQTQTIPSLNMFYPPGAQQPHHPPHIQVIMQQQQHPNQ